MRRVLDALMWLTGCARVVIEWEGKDCMCPKNDSGFVLARGDGRANQITCLLLCLDVSRTSNTAFFSRARSAADGPAAVCVRVRVCVLQISTSIHKPEQRRWPIPTSLTPIMQDAD